MLAPRDIYKNLTEAANGQVTTPVPNQKMRYSLPTSSTSRTVLLLPSITLTKVEDITRRDLSTCLKLAGER
jgi:hypothetical protein